LADDPADLLAGRGAYLAQVGSRLAATVAGEATTLLITGDAGVGKTSLAEAALASFGARLTVISGGCLPLQALSVPLHPFRLALRSTQAPGAAELLPELEVPDRAPQVLDGWIDRLTAQGPVVVMIDDLQWADQSTLDVLVYLAAGPRSRRLALAG
jgi:predicted ATPase